MAAIVAVMLGSGVLIGSGALVVDVGLLYVEREELQSGADAASYEIAMMCAKGSTCTSAALTATAVTYANKNALDGKAAAQVCVNGTGCPAWNTAVTCPPLPTPPAGTSVGNYVEVRTSTLTASNGTLIPPAFAGAITGSGYAGKRVGACARVNWGPPADVGDKIFALGISLCDWKRMTGNGTTYYGLMGSLLTQLGLYTLLGLPAPVAGNDSAIPPAAALSLLGLPVPSCTTPADATVPRGYVWLGNANLTMPDNNCDIDVSVGDWPQSFLLAGLFVGTICGNRLAALAQAHLPVLVPIYDQIQPALVTLTPAYHIVGFAPFVVTGYANAISGLTGSLTSLLSGSLIGTVQNLLCGLQSCINGYFTKTLVPLSHPTFGTGSNFGATVIGRTG